MCVQISGNVTAGSTNSGTGTTSPGINLRKQGNVATTNVFGIVGLSPSPTGTPNVENHVNGLNTSTSGTFGVGGTALLSGTSGFVSCSIP
jgi:large repetitive protein